MFESLTDRMSKALRNLRGLGRISEENIGDALQEVNTALLSADVHFKIAKDFINRVKASCIGQDVLKSVTPGQQIVKIIHDELVATLGEGSTELSQKKPLKILLLGLHGSGKTTSAAKLAYYLKKKGYKPGLVACDVYRPAAITQLQMLAQQIDVPVFTIDNEKDVVKIGKKALDWASENTIDAIIFDTAGRLQIDIPLIEELELLKSAVMPDEALLVADSALGQEAVNVAKTFNESVQLTGIILTKLDGDARGGAALSMRATTGAPIKMIGIGEKIDDLDAFHPKRMAQRILGMGDVVSLVEKAEASIDKEVSKKMADKFKRAEFDLEDFLAQLNQIKKMGPLSSIASMIPGMSNVEVGKDDENQLKRTEAIILSMTPKERRKPDIINGSRRLRIAKGSGTEVRDVNQLLKQFGEMKKMMKMMKGGNMAKLAKKFGSMKGGQGFPGLPF